MLGNAVKFTFKGYVRVNVNYDQDSEMLSGTVEDTGIGIKEENLGKLF